ncbi:MAG: MlaD family protein [Acidobacteriota bacterium]|nr:MlaD family protein [Acidobacteriota bacterium]
MPPDPHAPTAHAHEIRVGLLVLVAVGVLAAAVLVIGDKNQLFTRKSEYFVYFQNVGGLKPGNPVELNGVEVGTVKQVVLPQKAAQHSLEVWIRIDRRYAERLRAPASPGEALPSALPTQARIKTLGLLGDKYIDLNSGAETYPVIPEDGQIPSAAPTNVDAILASGENVMDNVVSVSHSLANILDRTDRGEGLLGDLTADTAGARALRGSLLATLESVQRVTANVESGHGLLPRLLNDRQLSGRLDRSLDRLDVLLASASSGPGLLPVLLNDPAGRTALKETLADLRLAAGDLRHFTAGLDHSQALLPRLVKDEAYGREVTDELRALVHHLDAVSNQLASGQGTLGKLIADPHVYDSVNDVLVGVDQSWMLRWLIRNRQKAGIKSRYDDATSSERHAEPPPKASASGPAPPPPNELQDGPPGTVAEPDFTAPPPVPEPQSPNLPKPADGSHPAVLSADRELVALPLHPLRSFHSLRSLQSL